jgi:hypothetical protein
MQSININFIQILSVCSFLPRVESPPFANVLAACIALYREGVLECDGDSPWADGEVAAAERALGEEGGVEVGWIVFIKGLAFGHCVCVCVCLCVLETETEAGRFVMWILEEEGEEASQLYVGAHVEKAYLSCVRYC